MNVFSSELLFYFGAGLMAVSAVLAVAAVFIFIVTGKRLKAQLEHEYGKKRK